MSVAPLRAAWCCVVLLMCLTAPAAAQMPPVLAPTLAAFVPLPATTESITPAPQRRATASATAPSVRMAAATGRRASRRTASAGFLQQQLRQPRVRAAYRDRADRVLAMYDEAGVSPSAEVFFRVFKREQVLEIWARDGDRAEFALMASYPVCRISGRLGPKRRQGDLQIPEGFYTIDLFNPRSQYHLSMRVDYPNAVDRARRGSAPLGGDIYLHGGCVTVGCVPLTDEGIEDVYLIATHARAAGQERIPVHIFPTRLDDDGIRWLAETYGADFVDFAFWQNLREGYVAFERTHTLPSIQAEGTRYAVQPAEGPAVAALPLPLPALDGN